MIDSEKLNKMEELSSKQKALKKLDEEMLNKWDEEMFYEDENKIRKS